MQSGHMLREGTWPDRVPGYMGLANVHVTQIVYGKSWWEEALQRVHRHIPWLPAFAIALSVQNA